MSTSVNARKAEEREVLAAICVNTFVWITRLIAGLLSGSSALVADAWHSMSDNASSLVVYLASRIASKPPDESHPYGHGKSVDIGTFVIGLMLLGVAFFLAYESITRFFEGYSIFSEYAIPAIIVLAITGLFKELLARYALKLYNETGSPLCKADAWHHRLDALTGLAVLPVFVAPLLGLSATAIDLGATIIIVALIFYEGVEIIIESLQSLMDYSPRKIIDVIEEIIKGFDKVLEVHDIRVRRYGEAIYVEMKVHVEPTMTIKEAHDLTEKIEEQVKEKLGRDKVIEVLVHVEPTIPHK